MWTTQSTFYQIYPLGFCGAPLRNEGAAGAARIGKVADWIPHMQRLGVDALYLCPVFESDTHGYDTRDYRLIDRRLGSNAEFAALCDRLHGAGIRVVPDGVFHHVGRGFWAYRDLLEKREHSAYRDWFFVDFARDSNYGDGLWYEGWEGHYEMVKLNLRNPGLRAHLLDCVRGWMDQFGIDGLRLDVAYLLDEDFLRELHAATKAVQPDFFLLGEAIHGDYNRIVNPQMLDSCTNYECYKGVWSSFNDRNMYEIAHSLNRQFGAEEWTIYRGMNLYNFLDNHDGSRLASQLRQPEHLEAAYGLMFGIPGIPSVYYGSEWGEPGEKVEGTDDNLRPCFAAPRWTGLCDRIAELTRIRREQTALQCGGYRQLYLTNPQLVFEREWQGQRVIVAVNADEQPHAAQLDLHARLQPLSGGGAPVAVDGALELAPRRTDFYRVLD